MSTEHFEEGEEAPPKGVRAMAIVRWVLLAAMALIAVTSVVSFARSQESAPTPHAAARYVCPMHPQVVSDRPGECPICHMTLVLAPEVATLASPSSSASPATSASASTSPPHVHAAPSTSASSAPVALGYTCPMHPEVHASSPGRCPYCGMDLVAVEGPKAPSSPPDTAAITLSLDRVQLIGVRTVLVEKLHSEGGLRLSAAVEVPEQGRAEVHVRAAGWVESVQVKDLGVKVKAGEPLVSVYSPEVLQAEQELIAMSAWPTVDKVQPPTAAARRKLELLGLGKGTIDKIVASGQAVRAMSIGSPIAGWVTRKDAVLGSYAMPDKVLFEVADLASVYLVASAYPHQVAVLRVGDEATFTTASLPGHVFSTKVDLVYPAMDLSTRTARVRFRIDNKDLNLRPGQFGTVDVVGRHAEALTLPLDAVIDTGRYLYVFVVTNVGTAEQRFEARNVELGEQIGNRFTVRSGLSEGERVVSSATFLIDAESRLQASLASASSAPSK